MSQIVLKQKKNLRMNFVREMRDQSDWEKIHKIPCKHFTNDKIEYYHIVTTRIEKITHDQNI